MNIKRRKKIALIISEVTSLSEKMESILNDLETIKSEEEECFENIPENLQDSERYTAAEEAVENLDSAYDTLQEAIDSLADVVSSLEEASN